MTDFAALRQSVQSGPTDEGHEDAAPAAKPRRSSKRKLVDRIIGGFVVTAVVAAGALVWLSMQAPESTAAPLPEKTFEVDGVSEKVTGPLYDEAMPPEEMAPGTMSIPALGVYTVVENTQSFVSSQYAGFTSLAVPDDPQRSTWYNEGAPLAGGDEGATLVASHVSAWGEWGVLRYLYTLQGGEMIYTKDYDGKLQSWQVTAMRVEHHTEFPQEYWSAEGERYLVVTTCGGPLTSRGTFESNLFVIAHPVDPLPRTPEQIAADEEKAAAEAKKKETEEQPGAEPEDAQTDA